MPDPKPRPLTPKQRRFVEEYVVDFNGSRAARDAGYSEKTACAIAAENLRKPHIQEAIRERIDELSRETGVTAERALAETGRLAFSRMDSYLDFGPDGITLKELEGMTEEEIAAIGEVSETITKEGGSLRFKLHDKKGALDQLHRIFGAYRDTVEHKHTGQVKITEVTLEYPEEEETEG